MLRPSTKAALYVLAATAVVVPAAIKAMTEHQGAKLAVRVCGWLNARAGALPDVEMAAQTKAILDDVRAVGSPVECGTGSSPHGGSVLTETAILLRPQRGPAIGLRVKPLGNSPHIVGYWTR